MIEEQPWVTEARAKVDREWSAYLQTMEQARQEKMHQQQEHEQLPGWKVEPEFMMRKSNGEPCILAYCAYCAGEKHE